MTGSQTHRLLSAFQLFCAQDWSFADFSLLDSDEADEVAEALSVLIGPPEKAAAFEVFGKTGTGSYIAFWQEPSYPSTDYPIVWLDSAGLPRGVFANSFEEFLTLLPYGNGLIVSTLLFCIGVHPRAHLMSLEQFAKEVVPGSLGEEEQYSGRNQYITWLTQTTALTLAERPVADIARAYHSHTKVETWLLN